MKRKKKQSLRQILLSRAKALAGKAAVLYLIASISSIPYTSAAYLDVENSKDNSFSAGSLNFSLRNSENNKISKDLIEGNVKPGEEIKKTVTIKNEGTMSFKYNISFEKTGGSDAVCSALKVGMERDGLGGIYTGPLADLGSTSLELTGSEDTIEFRVFLEDESSDLQGKTCAFDLNFRAKQKSVSGGYSYERTLSHNNVSTTWWISPTVKVDMPNGGETYAVGDDLEIKWTATSSDPDATDGMKIDIYLSTDSGNTYPTKIEDDTENDGSFHWTIDTKSPTMRIKVVATDSHELTGHDESDEDFDPVEEPTVPVVINSTEDPTTPDTNESVQIEVSDTPQESIQNEGQ